MPVRSRTLPKLKQILAGKTRAQLGEPLELDRNRIDRYTVK